MAGRKPALTLAGLYGLAQRHGLSAYDASYLALAQEIKLPVACGDASLRAALKSAGVKLV